MMFAYSFLAMTSYNSIKPITRSKFISDLGADNLPYVQFASGSSIGFIMQGYASVVGAAAAALGTAGDAGRPGRRCSSCSGSCSRPSRLGLGRRSTSSA